MDDGSGICGDDKEREEGVGLGLGRQIVYFFPVVQTEHSIDVDSEIGIVRITATGQGITGISFAEGDVGNTSENYASLTLCKKQLLEYFSGKRNAFHDMPLAIRGTDFQQRVWSALLDIPFGSTVTYADITANIGEPRALRAVGTAVGRNPFVIVIPCHRVLPSDKAQGIGNYSAGSWRKKWLLEHEGYVPAAPLPTS